MNGARSSTKIISPKVDRPLISLKRTSSSTSSCYRSPATAVLVVTSLYFANCCFYQSVLRRSHIRDSH